MSPCILICVNSANVKYDRFVRIAEARTNKILEMLRLLGNCSSKTNYDYTDADVRKIFDAIERELRAAKNKFSGGDLKKERFSLK